MKILLTGSSGLIGAALLNSFRERGYEVKRIVRSEKFLSEDAILWDPEHHEIRLDEFEGFDVVINLAGENIASGRWTEEKKKKIRDSRVLGTHMLAELLARLERPPSVFVSASAIGYYGDRADEKLSEQCSVGQGFLAEVCQKWEEATGAAKKAGIRVVNLRIGAVLSKNGGVLSRILPSFKYGLGGIIGSGKQFMSWISIDDLIGIVLYVINHEGVCGPINVVSPEPVTNYVFTKTLGKILRRPTFFPFPAFLAKLVLGEMADELLLSSCRAIPQVLQESGYQFLYPDLKGALQYILGGK